MALFCRTKRAEQCGQLGVDQPIYSHARLSHFEPRKLRPVSFHLLACNRCIICTVAGGVSINGKNWGRPDDTVGIAGVVNNISGVHRAFFDAGGLGILIGDGQLPNPGLEKIFETYYSYALSPDMRVSFDYQYIANPAYNTDRGPVNTFAGRFHAQF